MVCDKYRLDKIFKHQNTSNLPPQLQNEYNDLLRRSESSEALLDQVLTPVIGVLMVFSLSINMLMIIGIIKTNKKLLMSHKLLCWVCINDLMVALITMPHFMASNFVSNTCLHTTAAICFGIVVSVNSMQALLLVSVLRYRSIKYPLETVDDNLVSKIPIAQIVVSVLSSGLHFYFYYLNIERVDLYYIDWLYFGIFTLLCAGSANFFNAKSSFALRRMRRNNTATTTNQHLQRHRKAVTRLRLMSIVTFICYAPNIQYQFYAAVRVLTSKTSMYHIFKATLTLDMLYAPILLCPALNSLAYVLWDADILKYYKTVLETVLKREHSA